MGWVEAIFTVLAGIAVTVGVWMLLFGDDT